MKLADAPTTPAVGEPTPRGERHRRLELVAFALLAYVPFLVSSPGRVTADTKQYLYLDPDRLLSRRRVPLGLAHRVRHRLPPDHRLPVPDGAVLLAHRPRRDARLGRATPLARVDLARRRPRRPVAVPHARRLARRRDRRRARLHAHALPARVHGPDLGAAPGVGRVAVAGRAGDAGGAPGRLARPGAVRAGDPDHRQRQRVLAASSCASVPPCGSLVDALSWTRRGRSAWCARPRASRS